MIKIEDNREAVIDSVIRLGVLDINGNMLKKSKESIFHFYKSTKPSAKVFGEYLNKLYAPHIYQPVNLPIDDRASYKPFKMVYNDAGLQFQFRDRNRYIHIECITWNEVAKRTARMIQNNEYFYDKPSADLRKNNDMER